MAHFRIGRKERERKTNSDMANDNEERINKSMPTEERVDRNELASPNLGSQTIKRSQVHCALSPRLCFSNISINANYMVVF